MAVLLITGLALLGASAALVARAVVLPRTRALQRLDEISVYGLVRGTASDGDAQREFLLNRLAGLLGQALGGGGTRLELPETRRLLVQAGYYTARAETLLGYRLLLAPALALSWLSISGGGAGGLVQAIVVGAIAWLIPQRLLRLRAQRRTDAIDDALPDLVDILVVTVEAGLAFSSSLQLAADRVPGPLREELRLTMQENRMGLPIADALNNLMARVDTDAMRSFVRSVVQGESLGVSIGTILRNVADEMRHRRRARAEERANKAPIKMLFPLVFLIFPALFVVILAPGAMQLIEALGDR